MGWVLAMLMAGCAPSVPGDEFDAAEVRSEVSERVWEFHAADTARSAERVIALLWPEYRMMVDGQPMSWDDVAAGARGFMPTLEVFHTVWTDLEVTPLEADLAISSFSFRDSIVDLSGVLTQSRGPTTLVWQKRGDEWRAIYGDADHYPIGNQP